MLNKIPIAAITGGRGLVGVAISIKLIKLGWDIKILSRCGSLSGSKLEKFKKHITIIESDISDKKNLHNFVDGVDAIFHCAGEIYNNKKMYSTNVEGTRDILEASKKSKASFFCYISSAGVVGPSSDVLVTEEIECHPQNTYEKTKYEEEILVKNAVLDMSVCILRPTNVVSKDKIGVLSLAITNGWYDKVKVFLKGGEATHLIHVEDVANAAIYFMSNYLSGTHVYFVSIDENDGNTLSIMYNLCRSMCGYDNKVLYVMPLFVPYLLRTIFRGRCLYGNRVFSNKKIINSGFVFEYNMIDIIEEICINTPPR